MRYLNQAEALQKARVSTDRSETVGQPPPEVWYRAAQLAGVQPKTKSPTPSELKQAETHAFASDIQNIVSTGKINVFVPYTEPEPQRPGETDYSYARRTEYKTFPKLLEPSVKGISGPRLSDIIYGYAEHVKKTEVFNPFKNAPRSAWSFEFAGGMVEAGETLTEIAFPYPVPVPARPLTGARIGGVVAGNILLIAMSGSILKEVNDLIAETASKLVEPIKYEFQSRAVDWLTTQYMEKGPLEWKGLPERFVMKITRAGPYIATGEVSIPTAEVLGEGLIPEVNVYALPYTSAGWEFTESPRMGGVMITKYPTDIIKAELLPKAITGLLTAGELKGMEELASESLKEQSLSFQGGEPATTKPYQGSESLGSFNKVLYDVGYDKPLGFAKQKLPPYKDILDYMREQKQLPLTTQTVLTRMGLEPFIPDLFGKTSKAFSDIALPTLSIAVSLSQFARARSRTETTPSLKTDITAILDVGFKQLNDVALSPMQKVKVGQEQSLTQLLKQVTVQIQQPKIPPGMDQKMNFPHIRFDNADMPRMNLPMFKRKGKSPWEKRYMWEFPVKGAKEAWKNLL